MRAFIDQIHNGIATLLLGDDGSVTVAMPVSWLPPDAHEGSVLCLDLRLDAEATAQAKQDIRSLLDELGDTP